MSESKPWFRMYNKFATDPIMQSLAFEDQRHFVILLCMKCDGVLDRPLKGANRDRIICRGLGLDSHAAEEAKARLMDVGIIDKKWQPKSWDKLQFVSDSSTPRSRNSRKNKETGNGNATAKKRCSNAPDTETDTYKEKSKQKRKTQLPENFILTPEREGWFIEIVPGLNAVEEFEHFASHHKSKGSVMADWDQAWLTWCRQAKKFNRGNSNGKTERRPSAPERVRAATAKRAAEEGY